MNDTSKELHAAPSWGDFLNGYCAGMDHDPDRADFTNQAREAFDADYAGGEDSHLTLRLGSLDQLVMIRDALACLSPDDPDDDDERDELLNLIDPMIRAAQDAPAPRYFANGIAPSVRVFDRIAKMHLPEEYASYDEAKEAAEKLNQKAAWAAAEAEAYGPEGNGHDLPTCRACGYPGTDEHEECDNCAEGPNTCPSNHWNDGNDVCTDCGADLQADGEDMPVQMPVPEPGTVGALMAAAQEVAMGEAVAKRAAMLAAIGMSEDDDHDEIVAAQIVHLSNEVRMGRDTDPTRRAACLLQALMEHYDTDPICAIRDALGDLRHACDLMGEDFESTSRDMHREYRREVDRFACTATDMLITPA